MQQKQASCRDHTVIAWQAVTNRRRVGAYLAAVDRVVAEVTKEQEREQQNIAERQRRLGELGNRINELVSDLSETRRHVSHRFTACVITKISKHVHL